MPKGVDAGALYSSLVDMAGEPAAKAWWQWFTTTYADWAREGWTRIDQARANCPRP